MLSGVIQYFYSYEQTFVLLFGMLSYYTPTKNELA